MNINRRVPVLFINVERIEGIFSSTRSPRSVGWVLQTIPRSSNHV